MIITAQNTAACDVLAGSRNFWSSAAISSSQPRRNHFQAEVHFLYHQSALLLSVLKLVDGVEELREVACPTILRAFRIPSLPYRPPVDNTLNTSWTTPYYPSLKLIRYPAIPW